MAHPPFKVIETGKGFKLVSDKYKGKGIVTTKQPLLHEFSDKDQAKLKAHTRQHHPCVSIHGGKISNQLLQDLLKKSYEKRIIEIDIYFNSIVPDDKGLDSG